MYAYYKYACQFIFLFYTGLMSMIYQMPGNLIRRLHQISTSVFTDRTKDLGVDITAPQFAALMVLSDHKAIDQATLAGMIALDRTTIGGVVERMLAKDWLTRTTSQTDRRAKVLELTAKGQTLLDQLKPIVHEMQQDILPGLSAEERDTFIRLAQKAAETGNTLSRAPLVIKVK